MSNAQRGKSVADRGRSLRRLFLVAVVSAAELPVASQTQAIAGPVVSEPVAVTAEASALEAAARTGVSVQVAGSQTQTSRSFATPDGKLLLDSYSVPRWVARPDSGWRQIDKRLRLDNGVLAPVATLTDTQFSPGGAVPLVAVKLAGGSVSFSWPTPLPTPQLDYDTAIYRSVLDGVDLRVRALPDGFTWSLVVQSRTAAQNPALDSLRFKLATSGLSVASAAAGGFVARDAAGATVMSADNAVMWDAAGTTVKAQAALNQGKELAQVLESIPDTAHQAELPTKIDGGDLVISPNTALLRGADTVYPVVIDPFTTINKIRWGYTNQSNANKNDGIARVGNDPDGTGLERSFFAFNLASLAGKQIRSAKFLTTMVHSYSCTSSEVSLWRFADLIAAGKQSWAGPSLSTWLQSSSGHAHKPSGGAGCSDDPQPDLPMEFAATALKNDIDTNKGQTNHTLALSARRADGSSESTQSWWKKFDPADTKLTVEYNTPPNVATAAQMTETPDYTAAAAACVTGSSRPQIRSTKPWIKAVLTDNDGTNGGSLRGDFTLQRLSGSTWSAVTLSPSYKAGVAPANKAGAMLETCG